MIGSNYFLIVKFIVMKEKGDILIYDSGSGNAGIEVRLEEETVWLTQAQMQELFQQTKQNMSLHIKNIFNEKELLREATVKESLTVRTEGKRSIERMIEYYSLLLRTTLFPMGTRGLLLFCSFGSSRRMAFCIGKMVLKR